MSQTPPPPPSAETPPNPWSGTKVATKIRQAGAENRSHNREFPCPNCGADLRFDPGAEAMKCTHCEAEVEVPHVDDEEAQVSMTCATSSPVARRLKPWKPPR